MNISEILSTNPQALKIDDPELIRNLSRGFYLYEPTKYSNGILVRTVIKKLGDGNHEAHCHIFTPTSQDHQGTTLEMIKLGYLTQESLKHFIRHQHDDCANELEIRCNQLSQ